MAYHIAIFQSHKVLDALVLGDVVIVAEYALAVCRALRHVNEKATTCHSLGRRAREQYERGLVRTSGPHLATASAKRWIGRTLPAVGIVSGGLLSSNLGDTGGA